MGCVEKDSGWETDSNGNRLLFGLGYLGEGFYKPIRFGKYVPEYQAWYFMLKRCYCHKNWKVAPNYIGCTVSVEWLNFQTFASWHCRQKQYGQKGWELDKDLLIKGNRVYSQETCCLLPKRINLMIAIDRASNSGYPTGVSATGAKKKPYRVKVGADGWVGRFGTLEDAVNAYRTVKEASIKEVAVEYKEKLDVSAFDALMSWTV